MSKVVVYASCIFGDLNPQPTAVLLWVIYEEEVPC